MIFFSHIANPVHCKVEPPHQWDIKNRRTLAWVCLIVWFRGLGYGASFLQKRISCPASSLCIIEIFIPFVTPRLTGWLILMCELQVPVWETPTEKPRYGRSLLRKQYPSLASDLEHNTLLEFVTDTGYRENRMAIQNFRKYFKKKAWPSRQDAITVDVFLVSLFANIQQLPWS